MDVPHILDLREYIAAFYTSPLVKIERALIGLVAGMRAKALVRSARSTLMATVSRPRP